MELSNEPQHIERIISSDLVEILKLKEDTSVIRAMFVNGQYVEILRNPIGGYWEFIMTFKPSIITNSDSMLKLAGNIDVSLLMHPTKIKGNIPGVKYEQE
jgi:hypothetical protein